MSKAKVGDRIRIVEPYGTHGEYKKGDVLTVTHVLKDDNLVKVARSDTLIGESEYEVVRDISLLELYTKHRELTHQIDDLRQQRADIDDLIEKRIGVPLDIVVDGFIASKDPVDGSKVRRCESGKPPFDAYEIQIDGVPVKCFKEVADGD